MPVNTMSSSVQVWLSRWMRCRDFYEGSDVVKSKGSLYLPMLPSHGENSRKYDSYKKRALFYNAMARTVDGLAGAVFQKTPDYDVSKDLLAELSDITLTGVPLDIFSLTLCREILTVGRCGVLIDMPNAVTANNDLRPYWRVYPAESIYSCRVAWINQSFVFTRVVLSEAIEVFDPKDEFAVETRKQFRVLRLLTDSHPTYTSQVYTQSPKDPSKFEAGEVTVPTRRGEPLPFIPFQILNATSLAVDIEKPPLLDLTDVLWSHYLTSADLEQGRHVTSLPQPWVSGVPKTTKGEYPALVIGSGKAWILDKEGRAGMLEYTGQGLASLEKAEESKRKLMATLGARLLESQPSTQETATAVSMRHAGDAASLKTIAQVLEAGITRGLRVHDWWTSTLSTPAESTAMCELNKEFFGQKMSPQELQALLAALQADEISHKTFWEALRRGDIARVGVSSEEEKAEIARQRTSDDFEVTDGDTADI